MNELIKIKHENAESKGRFVLTENAIFAGEMTYTWAGTDKLIIDHTEVDKAFGGKGYGKKLLMEVVTYAREKDVKIIPLCPYAKSVFDKDESIGDVLFK